MDNNRPRSREKNVTGGGKGVEKKGPGLGTGPVGQSGGYNKNRPSYSSSSAPSGQRSTRGTSIGGGKGKMVMMVLAVIVIFGLKYFTGIDLSSGSFDLSQFGNSLSGTPIYSDDYLSGSGSVGSASMQSVNTNVDARARARYTSIIGKNADIVTIMVYMCGTDLESKSGMATADLKEMLSANLSDNINLLVYTGGCKAWKNNVVSSSKNQIYKVENGNLICLEDNMGSGAMTSSGTLKEFITWCGKNYPANRNMLIFWDHGGGSLSGYGYDEKNANSGSMRLSDIDKALSGAGMKFDFVGFDACLMATLETGLMLSNYADYMIASEETEPGIGWYYTDWLTKLGKDSSMPTLDIGKNIVDDFITTCDKKCYGQKATLSVVDLAELEVTIPDKLKDFSASTTQLIKNDQYKVVSDARSKTKEFSTSKIDQIDFVDFANRLNTTESKALAQALLSSVKYNRTVSGISGANGISIYFPYQKVSKVDSAVSTYNAIGMDSEYARCIKSFAQVEAGGQMSGGGSTSPIPSLSGSGLGSSVSSGDVITDLLNAFLSGRSNIDELDGTNNDFFKDLDLSSTANYLAANQFDASALIWKKDGSQYKICLTEKQWSLIQNVDMNMFFDDGEGYIDLGLDNVFEFDAQGNMIGNTDNTWLAINGQPVAYYHIDTVEEGDHYTITGRVPALLNDQRVNLILVFDTDHPYGFVAGSVTDYRDGQTDTVAKGMSTLNVGDKLQFLCDYYDYNGKYQDSYYLGDPITADQSLTISNVDVQGNTCITYRFTDIYNQHYWTEVLPR